MAAQGPALAFFTFLFCWGLESYFLAGGRFFSVVRRFLVEEHETVGRTTEADLHWVWVAWSVTWVLCIAWIVGWAGPGRCVLPVDQAWHHRYIITNMSM